MSHDNRQKLWGAGNCRFVLDRRPWKLQVFLPSISSHRLPCSLARHGSRGTSESGCFSGSKKGRGGGTSRRRPPNPWLACLYHPGCFGYPCPALQASLACCLPASLCCCSLPCSFPSAPWPSPSTLHRILLSCFVRGEDRRLWGRPISYVLCLVSWCEKARAFPATLPRLGLHHALLLLSSRMADHFALMTGRLLTESTLQFAIHEAFHVPSGKTVYDQHVLSVPEADEDGRPKSGVMVECRICQEEGDEAYMENPCSCKGSLKYAHHICIQRWCNEKGDTTCEICLQQFTPNYTAPLKLFRHGRNPISFRRAGERLENLDAGQDQENVAQTEDHAPGTSSFDSQGSNPKVVIYCRVIAIVLMALLVLHDAISLILGGPEVYSMTLVTLLMLRTAGIVIPIYIILISVTTLLHRYNQHQAVHEAAVLEPGGAEGLQPMPPQQYIINIQ